MSKLSDILDDVFQSNGMENKTFAEYVGGEQILGEPFIPKPDDLDINKPVYVAEIVDLKTLRHVHMLSCVVPEKKTFNTGKYRKFVNNHLNWFTEKEQKDLHLHVYETRLH